MPGLRLHFDAHSLVSTEILVMAILVSLAHGSFSVDVPFAHRQRPTQDNRYREISLFAVRVAINATATWPIRLDRPNPAVGKNVKAGKSSHLWVPNLWRNADVFDEKSRAFYDLRLCLPGRSSWRRRMRYIEDLGMLALIYFFRQTRPHFSRDDP